MQLLHLFQTVKVDCVPSCIFTIACGLCDDCRHKQLCTHIDMRMTNDLKTFDVYCCFLLPMEFVMMADMKINKLKSGCCRALRPEAHRASTGSAGLLLLQRPSVRNTVGSARSRTTVGNGLQISPAPHQT